jgi:RNA polymerase sigma-70 factor (ECF subfamily)
MDTQTVSGSWTCLAELRPALHRFVSRRCRDDGAAEDIVQEALIRASRYRGSLMDAARLRPWVMRIALNVFRDHVRRERRLPKVEVEPELFERLEGRETVPGEHRIEGPVDLGGAIVARPRVLEHLEDARDRLGGVDRNVLHSYYEVGRTCAETALVCELPPHLIKARLYRVRHRLRMAVGTRLRRERDPRFEGTIDHEAVGAGPARTELGEERRTGGGS